jgi:Domain of Unknown Function (DUF1206)
VFAGDGRAQAGRSARSETETLERSRAFRWLVRTGFVARGVTYGLIGALAFAIALGAGTRGATPNQQGALALIARSALGQAALVVICVGLLAYALWKFTQGVFGRGPEGGGGSRPFDRVANLAGGAVYLAFLAVAIRVLSGSSGNSSGQERHAAAGVLGWPGGEIIVGVGGGVLMAISVYQLYEGLGGGFARDEKRQRMGRAERRIFMLLGRIGLSARALVFGLVGFFLVRVAIDFNPHGGVGVDGALTRLRHAPLGPWVLGLVATGLIVFAAFSMLEARFRRL